jgi:hypothetical protein
MQTINKQPYPRPDCPTMAPSPRPSRPARASVTVLSRKSCSHFFSSTKGTLFYRLRKPKKAFLELPAMLTARNSLTAVAWIKGVC